MGPLQAMANLLVLGRLRDAPGPFDPAAVRSILVVRNDNIGDVICTTPALDILRAAFPRAFIAAVVCTLAEEAISGHRALDELFVYPKAKHKVHGPIKSHWLLARTIARLRRRRFDLVVAFRSQFSSSQAWLAYASAGRWRLGPEARGRKKRWGFFYNLPAAPPPPGLHEVQRCAHLLGHIHLDRSPESLYLKVPRAAGQKAAEFLANRGLGGAPAPVAVNVTRWAYRPDRLWPPERYRELIEALAVRPGGVVVTHAPADRPWVENLLEGMEPAPAVFSSPRLKEFAAVIARARAFVTAEGGPMHIAAAVGTFQVVIWGETPLETWRPWRAPVRIVGARGPVAEISTQEVLAALSRPDEETS